MSYHSAVQDFHKARRQAEREQILARLTGQSTALLCYEDVRDLLQAKTSHEVGYLDIPLDAIVGSVERCSDYTRNFLPVKDSDQQRWTNIKKAFGAAKSLPPIQVYRVGEVYFVVDGHHRVSVARQLGRTDIRARVFEIRARVSLLPDVQPDELLLKAEYASFLERTHLDVNRPQADLTVTSLGCYAVLEEQIEAQRQFMVINQKQEIPLEDAASRWYDKTYLPAVEVLRKGQILQGFPGRTETDLYLWVGEHCSALEEVLGWEVRLETAAADLMRKFSARPQHVVARASVKLVDAVTPDRLQTGPSPGTWRRERQATSRDDCLFANILVPVSGEPGDWPAVAQAAEIACRESAQLLGLHVVSSVTERESERVQAIREEFARHCEAVGVPGRLTVEVGRVVNAVCQRSRWADLMVLGLGHPPGQKLLTRLNSDFCTLVRRCPTPVLVTPGMFSPLERPLLAYDGGPKAREALFVASYLAVQGQVPLVVVSVRENGLDASTALAQARTYLESHGVEATFVEASGPVADAIQKTAEAHDNDLILMGGYEHLPVVEVMFGSVVDELLRKNQRPVLICR